jgi:hypothetical protein
MKSHAFPVTYSRSSSRPKMVSPHVRPTPRGLLARNSTMPVEHLHHQCTLVRISY